MANETQVTSMSPICAPCDWLMVFHTEGMIVAPEYKTDHRRRGDSYKCPECGHEVISAFGASFHETANEEQTFLFRDSYSKTTMTYDERWNQLMTEHDVIEINKTTAHLDGHFEPEELFKIAWLLRRLNA